MTTHTLLLCGVTLSLAGRQPGRGEAAVGGKGRAAAGSTGHLGLALPGCEQLDTWAAFVFLSQLSCHLLSVLRSLGCCLGGVRASPPPSKPVSSFVLTPGPEGAVSRTPARCLPSGSPAPLPACRLRLSGFESTRPSHPFFWGRSAHRPFHRQHPCSTPGPLLRLLPCAWKPSHSSTDSYCSQWKTS